VAEIQPTAAMLARFEERTVEHIARVAANLELLASDPSCVEFRDELLERGRVHDASKFGAEERLSYIWLTESFYRSARQEPFDYPPAIQRMVKQGVRAHYAANRHHPEFHDDVDAMTDVDLAEMVCDWTAMAQELGEGGGSARSWAMRKIGRRFRFGTSKTEEVYRWIALLDRLNGVA